MPMGADGATEGAVETISFLLVPGFSALAFFSAIEPLRVANRLAGRRLFAWRIQSAGGGPVKASNGMALDADGPLDERSATLVLCAGFEPQQGETPELMAALRRMWRRGATIGAMDTGTYLLARAGLLGDRAVTMHWEAVPAFRERFPDIPVTDELFETHQRLFTCAGGTAALDMMLDWIGRQHGAPLAAAVSEQFIHDRIRSAGDRQRLALSARLGTGDSRVLATVGQMERHIEAPLSLELLARRGGVTRRQMERLFESHLGVGPAEHYRTLRLERARTLVRSTDLAMIEIAMATGFGSESSLARAYRRHYGHPPGSERKR
ncbi:MAG TPA: GlxA family transcriptional regulator [Sphingomonas sp.]